MKSGCSPKAEFPLRSTVRRAMGEWCGTGVSCSGLSRISRLSHLSRASAMGFRAGGHEYRGEHMVHERVKFWPPRPHFLDLTNRQVLASPSSVVCLVCLVCVVHRVGLNFQPNNRDKPNKPEQPGQLHEACSSKYSVCLDRAGTARLRSRSTI